MWNEHYCFESIVRQMKRLLSLKADNEFEILHNKLLFLKYSLHEYSEEYLI